MHKFEKVKNEILELLDKLKTDEMLPSYTKLIKMYGVSEITLRKALIELNDEGLIYSKRRKGLYKAKPNKEYKDVYIILPHFEWTYIVLNSFIPNLLENIQSSLLEKNIWCYCNSNRFGKKCSTI